MDTFDRKRAMLSQKDWFPAIAGGRRMPLRDALDRKMAAPDEQVLVAELPEGKVSLLDRHISWAHVAQGQMQGKPWLISFCQVCNSGTGMIPVVDGRLLTFAVRGLYDGLAVLGDRETGSFWNHITGECMDGPLKGVFLETFPLRYTTVAGELANDPEAEVLVAHHPLHVRIAVRVMSFFKRRGFIPPHFRQTMGQGDSRRAKSDLGLGIWTERTRRFYPMEVLLAEGGSVLDTVDGRSLLVAVGRDTGIPQAFWTRATALQWEGDTLVLDSGECLRQGLLSGAGAGDLPRPMQMFTRWYGFSNTFPGCEIFSGA